METEIFIVNQNHKHYAQTICDVIETAAKERGTGIARRKTSYIEQKIISGNAVIALQDKQFAGFCYIETWGHGEYVANSGLIVHPDFRKQGLARKIKAKAFQLAQDKYPDAKVFGITTGAAVMKINFELGYRPVTFPELTQDDAFWKGCQTCSNYDILQRNQRKMCLCTGMLAPSKTEKLNQKNKDENA